jgi:hypothetical protein
MRQLQAFARDLEQIAVTDSRLEAEARHIVAQRLALLNGLLGLFARNRCSPAQGKRFSRACNTFCMPDEMENVGTCVQSRAPQGEQFR